MTRSPLRLDEAPEAVRAPDRGAVVSMAGTVRDTEAGEEISAITYEAYEPMAEREIRSIVAAAEKTWRVSAWAVHRLGRVPAGEAAVIVAAAGVHREEAFAACRFLIDEIKHRAPIWKTAFEGRR